MSKDLKSETLSIRVTKEQKEILDGLGGAALFIRVIFSLIRTNKLFYKLIKERSEIIK